MATEYKDYSKWVPKEGALEYGPKQDSQGLWTAVVKLPGGSLRTMSRLLPEHMSRWFEERPITIDYGPMEE